MSARKLDVREGSEVQKLIDCVNRDGLEAAASAYDTHPSTLSRWLKDQGYKMRRTWHITTEGKRELAENAR